MTKKNIEKSILLVLGDQLYPISYIKKIKADYVFMAEDYDLCQAVSHHKQKITLFFAAMRNYAEELKKK